MTLLLTGSAIIIALHWANDALPRNREEWAFLAIEAAAWPLVLLLTWVM